MKLRQLIERYIAFQQSLGVGFQSNAYILRAFGRAVGTGIEIANVRADQVDAFLAGTGPITRTWYAKLSALRIFYRYAISRGYVATAPLPTVIPKPPPRFVPYIYSHDELHRLLQATDTKRHGKACLEPITLRTILLLLYGTGLRIREAVDLNQADVDMVRSLLTVRKAKFGKTRLVPFGPQLGRALARYAARTHVKGAEAPFFTTRTGARVRPDILQDTFRILCARAGVRRTDNASYQPRLHDLRHTFAVHRLTTWYQKGADVQTLLPHLAVYLGHVCLASTQVYLTMTPELLQQAGTRFERYAHGGQT